MRVQKGRCRPGEVVSARMARRRCTAPRTPMATIAPIFTRTSVPYGVNRFDSAPTRICADAVPETATSTKQPRAMLEYRATTAASRSPGSTPRSSTSMTKSTDPQRRTDQVQPQCRHGGVVAGGAGGVALLRERDEADHRDAGGQGDHAPRTDGEAEHRDGRGDEDGHEPGEAEAPCR